MNKQDTINEIHEQILQLKCVAQTEDVKLKIQKLQQQLDKLEE